MNKKGRFGVSENKASFPNKLKLCLVELRAGQGRRKDGVQTRDDRIQESLKSEECSE